MANSIFVVFVAVFLLQIGTGKDIRWIKNSNWNNVDNWSLGRLPCKGDIASFSQVTPLNGQKPVIYFNANATVRKLMLPRNGRIVLKPSITIRLTANESCEVPSNTVPMAATGGEVNNFVGVRANKWECPENWVADDNSSITHAPCGSDVPVFPSDSAFSYITSDMEKISVESILLRAEEPPNFDSYDDELLLNLSVNTECQNNASLCPCIRVDDDCSVLASTALPTSLSTMTTAISSLSSIGSFATTQTTSSLTQTTSSLTQTTSSLTQTTSLTQATSSLTQTTSSLSTVQSSVKSSVSSSISSIAPSTSLDIFTPGNVGVTSTTSVPIPHISGPVGPIGSGGISGNGEGDGSSGSSAVMIGAVVGVAVVLLIVAIIITVIIIIIVRKRRYTETKHAHLEEDDHAYATKESGTAAYDNPVYECNLSIHSTDMDQMENPLF